MTTSHQHSGFDPSKLTPQQLAFVAKLTDDRLEYLVNFADAGIAGKKFAQGLLRVLVWVGSVGGAIAGVVSLMQAYHTANH